METTGTFGKNAGSTFESFGLERFVWNWHRARAMRFSRQRRFPRQEGRPQL